MESKKRIWENRLIFTIFGVSLVLNVVSIGANFGQRNRLNTSEAKSLGHVVAEMRQANDYFQTNKPHAVAMLTEVAGTLIAVQTMTGSSNVRTELNNIAYYLHSQASATLYNGLAQYVEEASRLLQSHLDKVGNYDLSYLSSDAKRLDEMIPNSGGRWG